MKQITFNEAVIKMADIFQKDYLGDEFDSFKEMVRCYCYEPSDIKDEVLANMREYECLDDDGDFINEDEPIPYKSFIRRVYAELKLRGIYE